MNTAALLSNARKDLDLFQNAYGHIVFEYLKGKGRKAVVLNGQLVDAARLEKIVRCYFEKVETVSKLTRMMNQEYLSTVRIEERRPYYAPKKWQAA